MACFRHMLRKLTGWKDEVDTKTGALKETASVLMLADILVRDYRTRHVIDKKHYMYDKGYISLCRQAREKRITELFIRDKIYEGKAVAIRKLAELKRQGWEQIPCGKCIGCKQQTAGEKKQRLLLEKKYYPDEMCFFVTTTYNEQNLPFGGFPTITTNGKKIPWSGTLVKKHRKEFYDKLRADQAYTYNNRGVMTFGVGEYGPNGNRPHEHHLLFGITLNDLQPTGKTNFLGQKYYHSDKLTKLWGKGNVEIGKIEEGSINYVTNYNLEVDREYGWRERYQEQNREPEYTFMTKSNGRGKSKSIGQKYFEDNWQNMYDTDEVLMGVNKKTKKAILRKPARYFDKLLDKINPLLLLKIKKRRKENAQMKMMLELEGTSMDEIEYIELKEMKKINQLKMLSRANILDTG